MPNPEHLAILQDALAKKDLSIWNDWLSTKNRKSNSFRADLTVADFARSDLTGVDLGLANLANSNLRNTNLSYSKLTRADLSSADLTNANLTNADFIRADLTRADLTSANLTSANLIAANLTRATLTGVNLTYAVLGYTIFVDNELTTVHGLETVQSERPSHIGIDTLYRSNGNIPEVFLRGCGIPETMVTFAKSLVGKAIEYYSAFISYSTADEHFARRLHNDLQMNGVRVWFAPEDLKIGDPLKQTIDEGIRLYDKLIIVLSENSINRAWVHHEVSRALEKETRSHKLVLFPIRLDDTVFTTTEQWAYDIKQRYIGDFSNWTNPLLYQNAINRLLRDLNAKSNIAE